MTEPYDLRTLPRPSDDWSQMSDAERAYPDHYIVTSEGLHIPEASLREKPQEPGRLAIQGEERDGLRLHWLGILFLGGVVGLMLYDWLK